MRMIIFLGVLACRAPDGRIDDPCLADVECVANEAVCDAWFDEVARCAALCTRDRDCGPDAQCIVDEGEEEGVCWRTCRTSEDCADSGWRCVSALDDRTRSHCVLDL